MVEEPISLNDHRLAAVLTVLKRAGAKRILDLGCGEGRLIKILLRDNSFTDILGMDVSRRALDMARERLRLDRLPTSQRKRIRLIQGSLLDGDERLAGFDVAAVIEVIEHLDLPNLGVFEQTVFEQAAPPVIVVTTPNADYNALFPSLPGGRFRHHDHRFEWTRAEFAAWAESVAARRRYAVHFQPIGPVDAELGGPTQMAVFGQIIA